MDIFSSGEQLKMFVSVDQILKDTGVVHQN